MNIRSLIAPEKLSIQIWRDLFGVILFLFIMTVLVINFTVSRGVEKNIALRLGANSYLVSEISKNTEESIKNNVEFFFRRSYFKRLIARAEAKPRAVKKKYFEVTNYDFIRVVKSDLKVLVDSSNPRSEGKKLESSLALIDKIENSGSTTATIVENGKMYQVFGIALGSSLSFVIAGKSITKEFSYRLDELMRDSKIAFISEGKIISTAFEKAAIKDIEGEYKVVSANFATNLKSALGTKSKSTKIEDANSNEGKSEPSVETSDDFERDDSENGVLVDDGEEDIEEDIEEESIGEKERVALTTGLVMPAEMKLKNSDAHADTYLVYIGAFGLEGKGRFMIATSKTKAFALLNKITYIIIATGVGGLVIAFFLAFIISKTLTKNVNRLVSDVSVVREGNLDHEIALISKNEIGFLGEQFDSMRIAFKDSQEKLQDYADNLEEKVKERTEELTIAKNETDEIMNNVDQGLFLLDQSGEEEYTLGSQYSAELKNIFESDDIGNKDILKAIEPFVGDQAVVNTQKWLALMFKEGNNEKMLSKINPLREIEAHFPGKEQAKFLKFKFNRIIHDGQIRQLIGTVSDITKQVILGQKLAETEAENKRQMQMIFSILQIDPRVLSDFLSDVNEDLAMINETLKKSSSEKADLLKRLDTIYRSMHTIKGNSSLLNLDFIAEKAHDFEDSVSILIEKEDLNSGDFLGLVLKLNGFNELMQEVSGIIDKLAQFQKTMQAAGQTRDLTIQALEKTIDKFSKDKGKLINFDYSNYNKDEIPQKYRKILKDIMVQLVRNSISHGIESIEDRLAAGKSETGNMTLSSKVENDKLVIDFKDDGRGLQIEKIKQKAIDSGNYKEEELNSWDEGRIAQLIFSSGLSTAEEISITAGRGVGMDIIRERVKEKGGNIGIAFQSGKFCCFSITLPK